MSKPLQRSATFDLHMHSSQSDGRFEPGEVLEHAARGGLDVVALTDHDLIGALDPKVYTLGSRQVRVLAGAEISGVHDGREFHLLVYFPGDAPTGFFDFCGDQTRARADRYDAAVRTLALPGVPEAPEPARRGTLALTRHHLARALVDAGHADNLGDAFSRYATHPTVPHLDTTFVECIQTARRFGGVASWAHPPREAVNSYLDEFVEAGLQGLEGLRPGLGREDRRFFKSVARRHGLFLTGGSDWHGWREHTRLGLFQLRGQEIGGFLDALSLAA